MGLYRAGMGGAEQTALGMKSSCPSVPVWDSDVWLCCKSSKGKRSKSVCEQQNAAFFCTATVGSIQSVFVLHFWVPVKG